MIEPQIKHIYVDRISKQDKSHLNESFYRIFWTPIAFTGCYFTLATINKYFNFRSLFKSPFEESTQKLPSVSFTKFRIIIIVIGAVSASLFSFVRWDHQRKKIYCKYQPYVRKFAQQKLHRELNAFLIKYE